MVEDPLADEIPESPGVYLFYGEGDAPKRSMDIRPSKEAEAVQHHPIIRAHPETGREGLFSCFGYIIGIVDMDDAEAIPLLLELYAWQGREAWFCKCTCASKSRASPWR